MKRKSSSIECGEKAKTSTTDQFISVETTIRTAFSKETNISQSFFTSKKYMIPSRNAEL